MCQEHRVPATGHHISLSRDVISTSAHRKGGLYIPLTPTHVLQEWLLILALPTLDVTT